MRIISGTHKGRHIHPPKTFSARPTTDIAKESLFNIIVNNFFIQDCEVLDLFGGTGNISYEFASRGCPSIITVEVNYKNFAFIKKQADLLFPEQIKVKKADAFKYVKQNPDAFDIIFADPPFDNKNIDLLPDLIFESSKLKTNGWFILEHSSNHSFSSHKYFKEIRKYGKVCFSIFGPSDN